MDKLSLDDAIMIYGDSLFIRKGKLVKVRMLFIDDKGDMKVKFFDLQARRLNTVLFTQDEFKTPQKRIGYLNINRNALYVVRNPVRVYKGGLSASNLEVRQPIGERGNESIREAYDAARGLESTALLAAYNNSYPSLEKAVEMAKEFQSCCAFDKQFAVSAKEAIYYKEYPVGFLVNGRIQFVSGKEYLSTLLDGQHEKAKRTIGSTSL